MNIFDKIAEIRKKPEHVRMYYVFAGVFISMAFVIVIWIFSFSKAIRESPIKKPELKFPEDQFDQKIQRLPSIEEFMKQAPSAVDEIESSQQEIEELP